MNTFEFVIFATMAITLATGVARAQNTVRDRSSSWSYKGTTGVQEWPEVFRQCLGKSQSPINLEPYFAESAKFSPLFFSNYHLKPTGATVTNNGHSIQVTIDDVKSASIVGSGLSGMYTFAQYHLHWGRDSLGGSEHTISSVRYPMELHLVHYKTIYGSIQEAVKHADGLAVLGILFEISETDNPALSILVDQLPKLARPGTSVLTKDFYPLVSLLPRNLKRFYRYSGSLTTPTCNEVVTWTVFDKPISISERQLNAFRNLLDDNDEHLVDNYRPVQLLNHRKVYRSFEDDYTNKQIEVIPSPPIVKIFKPQYLLDAAVKPHPKQQKYAYTLAYRR